jgi:hypothetical protein
MISVTFQAGDRGQGTYLELTIDLRWTLFRLICHYVYVYLLTINVYRISPIGVDIDIDGMGNRVGDELVI